MKSDLFIRMATEMDAEALLKIYAPYVLETAITFEYEVPEVDEFAGRIQKTLKNYPHLVAVEAGNIAGYTYAGSFKERAAYDWAVETTVYLRKDVRGRGIGKKLYLALEEMLKRQNVLNLNACIAYAPNENKYLDNTSEAFHLQLGYKKVAHFTECGYKFDTWYDMIWMEKMLGEHQKNPAPFIPLSKLKD